MKLDPLVEVLSRVDYSPLTSEEGGRKLYRFVQESGVADVLELGFAHGTSSVYIAAALQESGAGIGCRARGKSTGRRAGKSDELDQFPFTVGGFSVRAGHINRRLRLGG